MSFRDNLQHLRATHSMTQEQLALMLGVSRQSVTKWEAERAYPEMDKLLKLCQIFDCTLDDLVQGDLTATSPTPRGQAVAAALRESAAAPPQDVCGYDEHMRAFARKIATGVAAILLGVSLLIFTGTAAERFDPSLEALGLIPLFAGIVIGVGLILSGSFQHTEFQRSHPYIQDFYSEGDRRAAQRSLTASIVIGISLIFIGVVASIPADGHGDFAEGIAGGFLVALVAAAAWLIIRSGMLLARLNVANYNASREQAWPRATRGSTCARPARPSCAACTLTSRSARSWASRTPPTSRSHVPGRAWSGATARASCPAGCAASS